MEELATAGKSVRADVAQAVARGAHEVEGVATAVGSAFPSDEKAGPARGRAVVNTIGVLILALAVSTVAYAQANLADEAGQSGKAARVFREIMDTPDEGIPRDLLRDAECVAVFPSVIPDGHMPRREPHAVVRATRGRWTDADTPRRAGRRCAGRRESCARGQSTR